MFCAEKEKPMKMIKGAKWERERQGGEEEEKGDTFFSSPLNVYGGGTKCLPSHT